MSVVISALRNFRALIVPWAVAGTLAASPLLFGLAIEPIRGARQMIPTFVPFAAFWPLQAETVEILTGVTIGYFGLGVFFTLGRLHDAPTERERAAMVCETGAAAVLCFVLPLLVLLWRVAWRMDVIPWGSWGAVEGYHGPWRRIPDLRRVLSFILTLPGISMLLARVALLLRPSPVVRVLMAAGVLMTVGLLGTHYWLIE